MNKISVIVPIYNVEKYLPTCLNSIINQTYKNLEILLINDGSSDNSGEICENYAKMDNRIHVFHKRNEGVSSARNLGIDLSVGDFISFVDPDDFLDLNLYEIVISNMEKYNADIICFNCYDVINEKLLVKKNVIDNITIYDNKESFGTDYFNKYNMTLNVPWNKLCRKEIFDNIRFPYKKGHEDVFIAMSVYMNAKKIMVIPNNLYYYRVNRKDSTMYNFNLKSNKVDLDFIESRIIWAIDYRTMCPNIKESYEWLFHVYKVSLDQILFSDDREKYLMYEKFLIDILKKMLRDKSSLKIKIGILKRIINIDLYCKLRRIIKK